MIKLAVSFVLIIALAVLTSGQSYHNTFGQQQPGDRLLHSQIVQEDSSFLRKVTKDVEYQTHSYNEVIHYIKIVDQYTDGTGGTVSILSGGPGANNVKLHFKSQRGEGFNFILEIYGR